MTRRRPVSTLVPYTTLFRSHGHHVRVADGLLRARLAATRGQLVEDEADHPSAVEGSEREAARAARDDEVSARRQLEVGRSEEHTSELQSLAYLVCRLLLEKK